MARVPLVTTDDVPDGKEQLLSSFRPEVPEEYRHLLSTTERNVYRTLGNAPEALEAFREFGGAVREAAGLNPRERELLILTAARELESAYEWHQHVRIALTEGLSREEILAIAEDRLDQFDPEERALMAYVAAFVNGTVDDDTYEAFADGTDDKSIVGVGLLVGLYLIIARQMDALDVETEEPFVGWRLENLDG